MTSRDIVKGRWLASAVLGTPAALAALVFALVLGAPAMTQTLGEYLRLLAQLLTLGLLIAAASATWQREPGARSSDAVGLGLLLQSPVFLASGMSIATPGSILISPAAVAAGSLLPIVGNLVVAAAFYHASIRELEHLRGGADPEPGHRRAGPPEAKPEQAEKARPTRLPAWLPPDADDPYRRNIRLQVYPFWYSR
jgi:hypothetical protein